MSFDVIQEMMKSTIGLDHESVGAETIKSMVMRRMKAVAVDDVSEYHKLIQTSAEERQHLINEITVPETWFFRDHEPFNALSDFVTKLKADDNKHHIRILSVPCSTGEEPYSIAMVLLDAGLDKEDFTIDAVDISTRVLEKAHQGVYNKNSFRGKHISFRDKYFEKVGENYQVVPRLKATVNLGNGNVTKPGFMAGKGPYDVIFCRNLLIYFDYETKCSVLKRLHALMRENGMLVLGHAETGRMPEGLFETLRLPGSFAYRKASPGYHAKTDRAATASHVTTEKPKQWASTKPSRAKPASNTTKSTGSVMPKTPEPCQEPVADDGDRIGFIQQLADEGKLKQALTECDKLIESVPDSVEGYYLKGLILLGFDMDVEAMDAFKKALYLDPKHYQSLIHLSVLSEEQGEIRAAENFRARADRLRESGQLDEI
jgi:chemotaxis protein methyltransferase WspC